MPISLHVRACLGLVVAAAGLQPCLADGQTAPISKEPSETLADAIALAYQTNPTLQAQRAQLRALDETYVQARTDLDPTVQVDANAQYSRDRLTNAVSGGVPIPSSRTRTDTLAGQVTVNQPLYTSGRATLRMRSATYRIRAGREALRATEGDIVFGVIQAFVDLRRDLRALDIRRSNLEAVSLEAKEIRARWRAGEVTRTDVAQAEAQLAAEQANVAIAENQVRASRIAYATIVGRNPHLLQPEPPLPNLPTSIERCWEISENASPELQQALFSEQQSRAQLQEARSAAGPTLSLRGFASYSTELFPINRHDRNRSLTGQLVLSQPIFNSGQTRSAIRQATETNTADRARIEAARRSLMEAVTDSWNQMSTLRANIARQQRQVEAAALAYKGMTIEYRAGQRSTLDLLNAEQTLRDAELAQLSAEHDAYLASALVLRYIGRLDAEDIVESLPRYDPSEHFRAVANKGAPPWDPLIRLFDRAFIPAAGQHSIPAPPAAQYPRIARSGPQKLGPPSPEVPITPIPGTVTNALPPMPGDPPARPR